MACRSTGSTHDGYVASCPVAGTSLSSSVVPTPLGWSGSMRNPSRFSHSCTLFSSPPPVPVLTVTRSRCEQAAQTQHRREGVAKQELRLQKIPISNEAGWWRGCSEGQGQPRGEGASGWAGSREAQDREGLSGWGGGAGRWGSELPGRKLGGVSKPALGSLQSCQCVRSERLHRALSAHVGACRLSVRERAKKKGRLLLCHHH